MDSNVPVQGRVPAAPAPAPAASKGWFSWLPSLPAFSKPAPNAQVAAKPAQQQVTTQATNPGPANVGGRRHKKSKSSKKSKGGKKRKTSSKKK